jgi:hypothetical protein
MLAKEFWVFKETHILLSVCFSFLYIFKNINVVSFPQLRPGIVFCTFSKNLHHAELTLCFFNSVGSAQSSHLSDSDKA